MLLIFSIIGVIELVACTFGTIYVAKNFPQKDTKPLYKTISGIVIMIIGIYCTILPIDIYSG